MTHFMYLYVVYDKKMRRTWIFEGLFWGTFPSLINPEAARCGETVAVGYISFFVCCFTFQATLAWCFVNCLVD